MFLDGVAVRHARQVIANDPMQAILAEASAAGCAEQRWIGRIIMKERIEQPHGAHVRLLNLGVEIEVLVKITAEFKIGFAVLRAVSNQRTGLPPHLAGARNSRGADEFLRR